MVGAMSPHLVFPLALMRLIYCFFVLCMHVLPSSAWAVSFSYNFSSLAEDLSSHDVQLDPDAFFVRGRGIGLTKSFLSESINNSTGRVWYKHPVPLWNGDTGEVASFTTSFSFNIRPANSVEYRQQCEYWLSRMGDGMAFFLAPWPAAAANSSSSVGVGVGVLPNATATEGGDLYLFNPGNHFNATGDGRIVAVEFDTFYNEGWDNTSIQHIGIDVNSIVSVAFTETRGVNNLTSPFAKSAVVSYDNVSKELAVSVQINGTPYYVNATANLTRSLPETVAVGFTASTGACVELHDLLSWSFNSTLQGPEKAAKASSVVTKVLLGVLVPLASIVVLVCAGGVGLLLWRRRKTRARNNRKRHADDDTEESDDERNNGESAAAALETSVTGPRRYRYRDLAAATGGFTEENLLGRGGFGSVYQGCLQLSSTSSSVADDDVDDEKDQQHQQRRRQELVAIKRFSPESSSQSRKEFEAEVMIIGRLRHRNLVRLLGWCDSRRGLLLVYELMPQGSLDKHIHSRDNNNFLTWPQRHKIILGLGSALHYLHRDWDQRVIHGDVKPSNIMLDASYNARLGDFGLARLGDHGTAPDTTDLVRGTMGYIDPEFVSTRRRSTESDVYSFGVVLLEIVSGRPPVDRRDPSFSLHKWVETLYICCQQSILDAADPRLRRDDGGDGDDERRQMERALLVGLWCAQRDPVQRPSIAEALQALQQQSGSGQEWKLPPALLSLHMYKKLAPPPPPAGIVVAASTVGVDSGVSGSSFCSGVRSVETAATRTGSSEESLTNLAVPPPHYTC